MFELHWWGSRSCGRPTRSLQPEMLTQAKPDREVEHQIDFGPSLAAWRDRRTKLNALIGGLAHPETDAQPLAFPCARDGQSNIGVGGGGRQVQIGLHVEFKISQRFSASGGVRMGQKQIDTEPDQAAHAIRFSIGVIHTKVGCGGSQRIGPEPASNRSARGSRLASDRG